MEKEMTAAAEDRLIKEILESYDRWIVNGVTFKILVAILNRWNQGNFKERYLKQFSANICPYKWASRALEEEEFASGHLEQHRLRWIDGDYNVPSDCIFWMHLYFMRQEALPEIWREERMGALWDNKDWVKRDWLERLSLLTGYTKDEILSMKYALKSALMECLLK